MYEPTMPEHTAVPQEQNIYDESETYYASQWQLVWRKFRSHRLAMVALVVLGIIYLCAIFAEFVAPYDPHVFDARYVLAPPQRPRFFSEDGFSLRPLSMDIQVGAIQNAAHAL